jgi:hypothetical protein
MPDDMLTVQEAAVVSGVDVRAVNDAIDRDVIPAGLFAIDEGRRIAPEGCVVVSFYNSTQAALTGARLTFEKSFRRDRHV